MLASVGTLESKTPNMPLYLNRCNFRLMSDTAGQHQEMARVNMLYKEFICCTLALIKSLFHLVACMVVVMLTVILPPPEHFWMMYKCTLQRQRLELSHLLMKHNGFCYRFAVGGGETISCTKFCR